MCKSEAVHAEKEVGCLMRKVLTYKTFTYHTVIPGIGS